MRRKRHREEPRWPFSDKSKPRKRLLSLRDKRKNSMRQSERQVNQTLIRKDLLKHGSQRILLNTLKMRRMKKSKLSNVLRNLRNLSEDSKENNIRNSLRINRKLVTLKPISIELRIIILKPRNYKFRTSESNLD